MDISVLLALDTAAFQQGLKAATDALGQFKAGADVCFEALGKAQTQIDAAADAAAKEAAKVTEAAEAARAQAQAEIEAAKATKEAAEAAEEAAKAEENHADKAEDLGKALGEAKGAMGVAGGAAAALSGDFQGVVRGTMQASQGMRAFGFSIKAVERASVVLAAIGAVIATVRTAIDTLRERAESLDAIRLEGLERGAEKARERFDALARAMERTAGLRRDLDDADGADRRLEKEKKLAELERDRNAALASGGDADEINKRFDAKKRELEFSFERQEAGAKVSGIQSEREDIAKQIARIEKRRQNAIDTAARYDAEAKAEYAKGDAGFLERVFARGDLFNRSNDEHLAKGDELTDKSVEQQKEVGRLTEELARLRNKDAVLARSEETAKGYASVIDTKEQAAKLAENLPQPPKKEPSDKPERDPAARGGGWGSMQMSSDRLARIGGFVGGGYTRQNEAREQVQLHRQELEVLKSIDRKTKDREGAVLA